MKFKAPDSTEVKSAAAGRWRDIIASVGIGGEFLGGEHGPCPKCGGRDRWRVFDDFDATGGAYCNQCGQNLGDGFALIQWWSGCDFPAAVNRVAEYLGVEPTSNGNGKSRIVCEYDYRDEAGSLLFQVCRFEPKDFRQRRPDGNGGWTWKTKGVRRVPYRLPELLANPKRSVFVVEGEKDVAALEFLGLLGTCNAGGAGKWTSDHAQHLVGRTVVVIPDRDEPGRDHARKVAESLVGVAKEIRVVELPVGKDCADFVAGGGSREQLVELVKAAAPWNGNATTSRQDASQSSLLFPQGRTESANARRLVERYGDVLLWVDPWNKWLCWDGKRWKLDDCRAVDALALQMVDDLWREAVELAKTADRDTAAAALNFVRSSNQAVGIRNLLTLARSSVAVLPSTLDTHPWLLNCQNGTLDLRTGTLRAHDKADFLTQICPVEYDADARFPTWRDFVHTILGGDRDLITYVQRLVGYCLTGSTREHLLPFLYGVGANGKSTFVSAVLAMLGPDYSLKAPTDLLLAKGEAHPTERADLYGKRFCACVEAEDGRRLAESLVKELTGGDRIRARRMREDFWEFTATHKIWLAANHKPTVRGTDHGIWRRIKLLPFTVTIPDDQQDKDLPAKLLDELPGILAWSVAGCWQWQQDGLREPACVRAATNAYRDEMDLVGRFITDCCDVGSELSVGASVLFKRFRTWCEDAGERAPNQTRFGSRLTERGFNSDKVGGRVIRYGLDLVDELH